MANITQEIALLERQKKSAKSNREKVEIMRKVKDLKEKLTQQQTQTALPAARKVVKQMPNESFKEFIARLKKKPEYSFLNAMGIGKIADDYRVVGKPVGWRIKGRGNYKVPSKKFRRENPDLVYYEDRKNRSDVRRPNRLEKGGAVNNNTAIFDSLKKGDKINITFSSGISRTNEKNLQVRSKNIVGKGKSYESEKITFDNLDNPTGVKFYAYKRKDDSVGFAMGDMAISQVVITKGNMMAKGGKLGDNYTDLLNEYNKIGAFLEDASNENERAKYKKQLDEIESKIHRHERNYEEGGMMATGGTLKEVSEDAKNLSKTYGVIFVIKRGNGEYVTATFNELDEELGYGKGNIVAKYARGKLMAHGRSYEQGGMMAKGGTVLANAKKKVAKMSDDEVVQEISTIYHYDMEDNDVEMEELYNDIDTARKELINHYVEEGTEVPSSYFAKGGSVKKKRFEEGGKVQTGVEILAAPKGNPEVDGNFLFPANPSKNTLGIKLAKGGKLKYYDKETEYRLGRPSGSIEKEILEKVKYYTSSDELFMGSFGWITPSKKIAEGYLYKLDDYDTNLLKDIKLKDSERIFRYLNRTTAIGGMVSLIKINLDKELLYFIADSDNDEIIFENKGVPARYIALIKHKMAKGGMTKKEFQAKKMGEVMHEFKQGDLHSGRNGKIVKNREQAIAIGLSEAKRGWKNRK